jgi:hypothetical protein
MMQCLGMSINASASDPPDIIFGVLSLLGPKQRDCVPFDYSMSYNQVVGLGVMLCIAKCGNLKLLMYAKLRRSAQPDFENTKSCTFGIEELRKFLLYTHGADTLNPTASGFYNSFSVKMISQSSHHLETVEAINSDSSTVL